MQLLQPLRSWGPGTPQNHMAPPVTVQTATHTTSTPSWARIAAVSNPTPGMKYMDRAKKATAEGQTVGRGQESTDASC